MLNSLAALMLLYVLRLWTKQGFARSRQQEERHGRRTKGPELASALRWHRAKTDGIRFRLRFENARLRWLPFGPSYRIPKRLESSHILMMGDTGAGKSNAIRQLLRQVRERGESAIVYDPAMDFVSEFYSPARVRFDSQSAGSALPVLESWQRDRPRRNSGYYCRCVPCRKRSTRKSFLPMGRAGYWPICSNGNRSRGTF